MERALPGIKSHGWYLRLERREYYSREINVAKYWVSGINSRTSSGDCLGPFAAASA